MKKVALVFAGMLMITIPGTVYSTPSTQIWIPSTDVQDFGTFHITADFYIPATRSSRANAGTITNLGLTVGILPFDKVEVEVGFDHINTEEPYPWVFNAKLGIAEDGMFPFSPAIAVGIYGVGLKKGVNTYNITYGLMAKTIPYVGRISVGYYYANPSRFDRNHGVLVSWDRTMEEISDRLWMAVDYQQGDDSLEALGVGFSWSFAENVSMIFGYVFFQDLATVQVDVEF